MAVIINGLLKGRLGDQVYSIRNGKNYVRQVRKIVTTSETAIARQQLFARAGKMCKSLKQQISESLLPDSGAMMYNRLMSSLIHWVTALDKGKATKGSAMEYFYNCHFNKGNTIKDRWHVELEFCYSPERQLQLKIPRFRPDVFITAPPHTASVEFKIVCAGCMPQDGTATGSFFTKLLFDYNNIEVPEKVIDLPVVTPAGALIVIAASLEYKLYGTGWRAINFNSKFMPSGVIGAMYV